MKKSLPKEDFYPDISMNYDLGYGSEGEYNIIKNILETEGFPTNDAHVKQALEFSKSAYLFLTKRCKDELIQYDKLSKKEFIVGCDILASVGLAHLILGSALAAVKIGKTLYDVLKSKSQEDKLLEGVVKKLEASEEGIIIAKKTTEFKVTVNTKPKKDKATKQKKGKKKTSHSKI